MGETHVFFVRHGESVDNVSRIYDPALTAHGVIQARRLGAHLAKRRSELGPVTDVFSSDLQRARTTAERVRDGLPDHDPTPEIVELAELREKDFGSLEGHNSAGGASATARSTGGAFVPPETDEALAARARRFLDAVLGPLLQELVKDEAPRTVVVVAHGAILSVVWLLFLARTLGTSAAEPDLTPFLSNTGFHEAVIHPLPVSAGIPEPESPARHSGSATPWFPASVEIKSVNCLDHLVGLKRTGGGIGSTKFDAKQKTIESFFAPKG